MPENEYSKRIKKLIGRWGEENKDKFEYIITKILIRNPSMHIKGYKNSHINYKPDAIFVLDFMEKIVFEVLDSQIETKTIADLVRCIIKEEVSDVVFIVKNNSSADNVIRVTRVILDKFDSYLNLKDTEKRKKEVPINVHSIKITETESKSPKKFLNKFDKFMKKVIQT